jgi:hypothetical protein
MGPRITSIGMCQGGTVNGVPDSSNGFNGNMIMGVAYFSCWEDTTATLLTRFLSGVAAEVEQDVPRLRPPRSRFLPVTAAQR